VLSLISSGLKVISVEPNISTQNCEVELSTVDVALKNSDIQVKLVNHTKFKQLPKSVINFVG
ncbi:MAG: hypothetical protein RIB63_17530, partial [Fulvivirga sp.]